MTNDSSPLKQDSAEDLPIDMLSGRSDPNKRQIMEIYSLLSKNGKMSFNQLADELDDEMARNTLKKRIEELKQQDIVDQHPPDEEWRRGKKKKYKINEDSNQPYQKALEQIRLAQYEFLFGFDTSDEGNLRQTAPGHIWPMTLEKYENDEAIDHVELCQTNARKMEGTTEAEFTEEDSVEESFDKLFHDVIRVAVERMFFITFRTTVKNDLSDNKRKDLLAITHALISDWALDMIEIWEDHWDVPFPDEGVSQYE
jgi:DNA-binding Lrp family transcriptional regulator